MIDGNENYSSDSRAQRAYSKRQKTKGTKYKTPMKEFETVVKPKVYKYREPGNIADHYLTKKYGVSWHGAHRYLTRVFGQEDNHSDEDLEKAAIMIVKEIGKEFQTIGEGNYPLYENFTVVVRNNVVVTILEKKD